MQSPDPLPIPYRPRAFSSGVHNGNGSNGNNGNGNVRGRDGHGEHEEGHEAERGGHDVASTGIGAGGEATNNSSSNGVGAEAHHAPPHALGELVIPRTTSPQSTLVDLPHVSAVGHGVPSSVPVSAPVIGNGSPPPTNGVPLETISMA